MDPKEKVNHNLNLCDKTSHKRFTSELIIKLIAYIKKLSNSPILAIPMIYKKKLSMHSYDVLNLLLSHL
jgi:maltooligosyltrehalose synthase